MDPPIPAAGEIFRLPGFFKQKKHSGQPPGSLAALLKK
jgi:hypothetical protein